ncbi:uncharacterized protein [Atheta coriaria]|uniref:uncharacterized protein n=1 Tax=Dalotia coriaria TaxID=877792 RepID=UPI0031F38C4D
MEQQQIHIQIEKSEALSTRKKSNVQLLPFKIHADCEAKVEQYFNNFVQKSENGQLSGSFRGYPLKGQTIEVPKGYKGVIFHESKCMQKERNLYAVNNFDTITYWNWSKIPSKNDAIMQALDWIDIAEALHSPINEE